MESVLWPYLLEFIVAPQYTEALAGVCKSIAYVAALKRENDDEDYLVDFEREGIGFFILVDATTFLSFVYKWTYQSHPLSLWDFLWC